MRSEELPENGMEPQNQKIEKVKEAVDIWVDVLMCGENGIGKRKSIL